MENKEIILKVGNDNGNSEHDLIINGVSIAQPNVFAKVRKLPNLDEVNKDYVLENIDDNLIVTCEDPSGIYYIGNYALKSGQKVRNIEVGIDNNKLESDVVIVNTLSQIAGFGVKEYYNKFNNFDGIINIKVDMTTALPISYYSQKKALEFADKFLNKTHMVTVHIGNSSARTKIEFEFVKVIPEGVTSIFALKQCDDNIFEEYNLKNEDKLNNDYFNNTRVLHAAIGEGTSEFPITEGIEFNPDFIKGTNNGMGHAIDKAIEEFKLLKGLSKFSRQDYSKVLIDNNHKFHDEAMEIVEQYIEEEAEEILHHVKTEIQKANNEVDVVCVYGGGSIFMRPYLESKLKSFCDRAEIKLLYIPEKYAVNLEAEGLYNFTIGKIFGALKLKYIESKNK
jgi:plasmid segregation protein ParM